MKIRQTMLTTWLARSPQSLFILYACFFSFLVYFCSYGFRKAFVATEWKDLGTLLGLQMKTALIVSQLLGYVLAKYLGIKFCSELKAEWRLPALAFLIAWAELALVAFGFLPGQWKVLGMFLNGLPLGIVWGVVVRYLEGRRTSEVLLAGLSCSFIVATGIVMYVDLAFVKTGVLETWAPAISGLCFLLPFLLGVWCLDQLPPPTPEDIALRTERRTMDGSDRRTFFRRFAPGLILLVIVYFFLTAYRDFRTNFAGQILAHLGYGVEDGVSVFTLTEIPVGIGVIATLAALYFIKGARQGLIGAYTLMVGGMVLMACGTLLLDLDIIRGDGLWWMITVGLCSYLAYVPYSTVLFDRLIASTRFVGTAVFTIYLADTVGWSGAIAIPIFKDLGGDKISHFQFFRWFTYGLSAFGTVLLFVSCLYFLRNNRKGNLLDGTGREMQVRVALAVTPDGNHLP
jgi:hypothetical protein